MIFLTVVAVAGGFAAFTIFAKRTWPPEMQTIFDLYLFPIAVFLVGGYILILIWKVFRS